MPRLQVLEDNGGAARVLDITRPIFTIGKKETCDLVLTQANVSRHHCQVVERAGRWFVKDLHSSNGTFLNGQRIAGEALLSHGARIQVANVPILFEEPAAAPPPAPAPASPAPLAGSRAAPPAAPSQPPESLKSVTWRERAKKRSGERRISDLSDHEARRTPVELKKKIHQRLLENFDLKKVDFATQGEEEIWRKTRKIVGDIVETLRSELPPWVSPEALVKEVVDEALGLGPLEDLLNDADVDEIMVNNWDRIFVERKGKIVGSEKRFTDNVQLLAVIRRILAPIGRRIDESSPMVDARLTDGSRVNAIIPPLALTGPTLTIRKFSPDPFTVEDLMGFGTLTAPMAEFLRLSVESKRNVCISGGTGSGKTTLLNVVSAFIPSTERIVTIEDAAELRLPQEHVVSLESKPPNIEGQGAIPIRKLVINALRMRPDRIIVGECRGGEAIDMLQAMNTGHDGSLTTIHANAPRDAISRLETMVMMSGMELPSRAIREQIASAINLIVHEARLPDGARKVTNIVAVTGMEGEMITLQDIFQFVQTGISKEGRIEGHFKATGMVPPFVHELKARGVKVDMAIFQ